MAAGPTRESRPCARCGGERHWTGSRWRCSPCYNAWQADYKRKSPAEQRERWNATRNESRRGWSEEYRSARNAKVAEWRAQNLDYVRQRARERYWADPDGMRSAKLAEYYRDPRPFLARNQLRKARLLEAVCEHGPDCVSATFLGSIYAAECVYCGGEAEEADHVVPLSRGGLHCQANIVPACLPCNRSKWANDPDEWIAERESSA